MLYCCSQTFTADDCLTEEAVTYSDKTDILKPNHPLKIAVRCTYVLVLFFSVILQWMNSHNLSCGQLHPLESQLISPFRQVRSSCQNLLLHPLVEGLLNYKWKRYCRYTFYGNFVLFTIFLIMFNVYMLTVPPYYKIDWNAVMENRKILDIHSCFLCVYAFPFYLCVLHS